MNSSAGDEPLEPSRDRERPEVPRDPLDPIAEIYLAARRRGERLSLAELMRRHPDQAERIRELFPVLEILEEASEAEEWREPPDDG